MQEIELSDGSIAEFPDHFSDDEIESILQKEWESPGRTPIESKQSAWDSLARPFKAQTFKTAEAINRGIGSFSQNLHELSQYIGSKTGMEPGGAFERGAQMYLENAEYWRKKAEKTNPSFVDELIGEAVGGAVPGIAEFMLNIPYAALTGAKEAAKMGDSETVGAITGGAKRYALGRIFHALGVLPKPVAAPAMGGVFATEAAASGGTPDEVAKSFGTGLLYGLTQKGRPRVGKAPKRVVREARAEVLKEITPEEALRAEIERKEIPREIEEIGIERPRKIREVPREVEEIGVEREIKAKPKTYDEVQKAIDTQIDRLMEKGLSFEKAERHPSVEKLYETRDKIGQVELEQSFKEISDVIQPQAKDPKLTKSIIQDVYAIKPDTKVGQYLASKYTEKQVKNRRGTGEKILRKVIDDYGEKHNLDMDKVLDPKVSGLTEKGRLALKRELTEKASDIEKAVHNYFYPERPKIAPEIEVKPKKVAKTMEELEAEFEAAQKKGEEAARIKEAKPITEEIGGIPNFTERYKARGTDPTSEAMKWAKDATKEQYEALKKEQITERKRVDELSKEIEKLPKGPERAKLVATKSPRNFELGFKGEALETYEMIRGLRDVDPFKKEQIEMKLGIKIAEVEPTPKPKAEEVKPIVAKEPHQMTQAEYIKEAAPAKIEEAKRQHRIKVSAAVTKGLPVSKEVLETYRGVRWADEALEGKPFRRIKKPTVAKEPTELEKKWKEQLAGKLQEKEVSSLSDAEIEVALKFTAGGTKNIEWAKKLRDKGILTPKDVGIKRPTREVMPKPKEAPLLEEITEAVREFPEVKPPTKEVKKYIRMMAEEVKEGERPRTIRYEPTPGQIEYRRLRADLPEFMAGKGWKREEVITALEKGIERKKLTVKQQVIYDTAKEHAETRYRFDEATLETFPGFQKMYEGWAARMKKKKARPKEDIKVFDIGKIVKQRTNKARSLVSPPVYEAELNVVKRMPELRPKPLGGWLENPLRTFEELGSDAKELYYRPVKQAEHRVSLERKGLNKRIKALKKGISLRSRKRIGAYGIAQQPRGKAIIQAMGVGKVPELKPKEMRVYNALRGEFESFYHRLNEARKLSGKEQFGKVENYFTFIRDLGLLDRMGFNPTLDKVSAINQAFIHLKTTPFRFAKARVKLGVMPVELDAFGIFEQYASPAVRHIHLSPVIAKLREFSLTFGTKKAEAGPRWILREEKPRTAKFLTEWLDFQAGQRPPTSMPGVVEKGLMKLNQNLTFAILSANIRSALIQPSALVNTLPEIGPKYMLEGIMTLLSPKRRNFAMQKSNVLLSRDYDVAVTDAMAAIRTGRIGELKKAIGRKALKPLQLLDMETAKATWQGAYLKAIKEGNYSIAKAINYADDVVTRTQGSAAPSDIAPIQRTALGKAISLFQTFVINQWGFLTRDVLGVKNPRMKNTTRFKKLLAFLGGAILLNIFYEDLLGINSPLPTPIKAFNNAIEEGEEIPSATLKVAKEIVEVVPIVGGGLRYGKGILGATAETIQELAKGNKPVETAAKLIGIPGVVQGGKMVRAKKRGETTYGIWVGKYTPKHKRKKKWRIEAKED